MRFFHDKKNRFKEAFNPRTGFYLRTDNESGDDPFMRVMPNLIDIGIMGFCDHGKNGLCILSGVQCYQDGLNKKEEHMSLADFENILKMTDSTVYQVALGGRGDPNKHPQFGEILKLCNKYNIVPNYTTSGYMLTDEEIKFTQEYCGAVAVSWYNDYSSIRKFIEAGVKTNIHYVLSDTSIDEASDRLEEDIFPEGVNAVIFLLHKPIGLGQWVNVLHPSDSRLQRFFNAVENSKVRVGFDSCSCAGIVNFTKKIQMESMDYCEAARFSCYIDAQMNMMPCSFGSDNDKYFVSLYKYNIKEAWNSDIFNNFRNKIRGGCPDCKDKGICSICPIVPEITLCGREEKYSENKN